MNQPLRSALKYLLVAACLIAGGRVVWLESTGSTLASFWPEPSKSGPSAPLQPPASVAELLNRTDAAGPSLTGNFPCVSATVTGSSTDVELGNCASPISSSAPVDRFEADLRYGRFILRQTDLFVSDVFDVPLTRTYNSGDYLAPNRVHAFGKNTNHPFDIAPMGSRFPYTCQIIAFEDGNFIYFNRVSAGTSYSDAVFQHVETSTKFYKAVTAWNGNGWTTWLPDGSSIVFPEAYRSTNMAQGAPTLMRDASGNVLKLLRDKQGNLEEIHTPHKTAMKFRYDGQTRIVRAEDNAGNWTEYQYNSDGMLTDAAFSSGHKRHYNYDGVLMTQILDENQHILVQNTYSDGFLASQDFGDGKICSYQYVGMEGIPYAQSTIVTLPDGSKHSINVEGAVPEDVRRPH